MEEESTNEANILFLSSDIQVKEYSESLLKGEGYMINSHDKTESFLADLENKPFDLILMDFKGENVNGSELCKSIRNNFMLRHIPIILLIEKHHTIDKIKGIYAGADDYIEKPPQAGELLTRVKASLWRAQRDLDANPLTKLPGNASILRELEKRIADNEIFCAAYADLDKFKEYNDYYGFEWGDKIIKHTAFTLSNAIKIIGKDTDFVGHIGGDDFLFITSLDTVDAVCKKVIADFDASISSFYRKEDKEKGCITIKDRKGIVAKIPFMTISIGAASNYKRSITHTGQIIQIATELKTYSKTFPKSIYIIDRRSDNYK